MPVATPAAVRRQIKSGTTDPIYLIQGDDEVEKSALAHEFEELVEEGLRAFNVERVHAGDLTSGDKLAAAVASIAAAARTLPMMSPRRVVIVFQADSLLVPKRESEAATRALGELETLLKDPERQTTLVLVAGSVDKRSRMYKLLLKQAILVECGVLADQADAERWVRNRIAASRAEIEPAAARLLAERSGTDVRRLRSDVERLLLAGRLGDDQRYRGGRRGTRAQTARPDARGGRPAGEDPRPARMARADEVPGARAWRSACSCRGAVPDRPRPQALRGRAPGAARASGGRVVYGKGRPGYAAFDFAASRVVSRDL